MPPRWQRLQEKERQIQWAIEYLHEHRQGEVSLAKLLRRPEMGWADIAPRMLQS